MELDIEKVKKEIQAMKLTGKRFTSPLITLTPEQVVELLNVLAEHFPELEELELSGVGLKKLPKEIAKLSNLKKLDLSGNLLTSLPKEIAKLSNLKKLDLGHNPLKTIPNIIEKLSNLEELNVEDTMVKDISKKVQNLPKLKNIKIEHTSISEKKAEKLGELLTSKTLGYSNLPEKQNDSIAIHDNQSADGPIIMGFDIEKVKKEIQAMKLTGKRFTSPLITLTPEQVVELLNVLAEHFPELEELELAGVGLKKLPKEIAKLSNLKRLDLSGNLLTSLPKEIAKLSNLKKLDLGHNPLKTIPNIIEKLSNLEELNVEDTKVKDISKKVQNLPKLKNIKIEHTSISEKKAEKLGELLTSKTLEYSNLPEKQNDSIAIHDNQSADGPIIMGFDIEKIKKDIQAMKLTGKRFTSPLITLTPEQVVELLNVLAEDFPELEELELAGVGLKKLPKEVAKLSNLKKLDLSENLLTSLPKEIAKLSNLKKLDLGHNPLTTIPKVIGKLSNLEELNVENTKVKALSKKVQNLPKLKNIKIEHTSISEKNAEKLDELLTSKTLGYSNLPEKQNDSIAIHDNQSATGPVNQETPSLPKEKVGSKNSIKDRVTSRKKIETNVIQDKAATGSSVGESSQQNFESVAPEESDEIDVPKIKKKLVGPKRLFGKSTKSKVQKSAVQPQVLDPQFAEDHSANEEVGAGIKMRGTTEEVEVKLSAVAENGKSTDEDLEQEETYNPFANENKHRLSDFVQDEEDNKAGRMNTAAMEAVLSKTVGVGEGNESSSITVNGQGSKNENLEQNNVVIQQTNVPKKDTAKAVNAHNTEGAITNTMSTENGSSPTVQKFTSTNGARTSSNKYSEEKMFENERKTIEELQKLYRKNPSREAKEIIQDRESVFAKNKEGDWDYYSQRDELVRIDPKDIDSLNIIQDIAKEEIKWHQEVIEKMDGNIAAIDGLIKMLPLNENWDLLITNEKSLNEKKKYWWNKKSVNAKLKDIDKLDSDYKNTQKDLDVKKGEIFEEINKANKRIAYNNILLDDPDKILGNPLSISFDGNEESSEVEDPLKGLHITEEQVERINKEEQVERIKKEVVLYLSSNPKLDLNVIEKTLKEEEKTSYKMIVDSIATELEDAKADYKRKYKIPKTPNERLHRDITINNLCGDIIVGKIGEVDSVIESFESVKLKLNAFSFKLRKLGEDMIGIKFTTYGAHKEWIDSCNELLKRIETVEGLKKRADVSLIEWGKRSNDLNEALQKRETENKESLQKLGAYSINRDNQSEYPPLGQAGDCGPTPAESEGEKELEKLDNSLMRDKKLTKNDLNFGNAAKILKKYKNLIDSERVVLEIELAKPTDYPNKYKVGIFESAMIKMGVKKDPISKEDREAHKKVETFRSQFVGLREKWEEYKDHELNNIEVRGIGDQDDVSKKANAATKKMDAIEALKTLKIDMESEKSKTSAAITEIQDKKFGKLIYWFYLRRLYSNKRGINKKIDETNTSIAAIEQINSGYRKALFKFSKEEGNNLDSLGKTNMVKLDNILSGSENRIEFAQELEIPVEDNAWDMDSVRTYKSFDVEGSIPAPLEAETITDGKSENEYSSVGTIATSSVAEKNENGRRTGSIDKMEKDFDTPSVLWEGDDYQKGVLSSRSENEDTARPVIGKVEQKAIDDLNGLAKSGSENAMDEQVWWEKNLKIQEQFNDIVSLNEKVKAYKSTTENINEQEDSDQKQVETCIQFITLYNKDPKKCDGYLKEFGFKNEGIEILKEFGRLIKEGRDTGDYKAYEDYRNKQISEGEKEQNDSLKEYKKRFGNTVNEQVDPLVKDDTEEAIKLGISINERRAPVVNMLEILEDNKDRNVIAADQEIWNGVYNLANMFVLGRVQLINEYYNRLKELKAIIKAKKAGSNLEKSKLAEGSKAGGGEVDVVAPMVYSSNSAGEQRPLPRSQNDLETQSTVDVIEVSEVSEAIGESISGPEIKNGVEKTGQAAPLSPGAVQNPASEAQPTVPNKGGTDMVTNTKSSTAVKTSPQNGENNFKLHAELVSRLAQPGQGLVKKEDSVVPITNVNGIPLTISEELKKQIKDTKLDLRAIKTATEVSTSSDPKKVETKMEPSSNPVPRPFILQAVQSHFRSNLSERAMELISSGDGLKLVEKSVVSQIVNFPPELEPTRITEGLNNILKQLRVQMTEELKDILLEDLSKIRREKLQAIIDEFNKFISSELEIELSDDVKDFFNQEEYYEFSLTEENNPETELKLNEEVKGLNGNMASNTTENDVFREKAKNEALKRLNGFMAKNKIKIDDTLVGMVINYYVNKAMDNKPSERKGSESNISDMFNPSEGSMDLGSQEHLEIELNLTEEEDLALFEKQLLENNGQIFESVVSGEYAKTVLESFKSSEEDDVEETPNKSRFKGILDNVISLFGKKKNKKIPFSEIGDIQKVDRKKYDFTQLKKVVKSDAQTPIAKPLTEVDNADLQPTQDLGDGHKTLLNKDRQAQTFRSAKGNKGAKGISALFTRARKRQGL